MDSAASEQALKIARQFLSDNPDIETIEVMLTDLNGCARGKWIPREELESVCQGCLKITLTSVTPDIWGRDVPAMCEATGDGDGVCEPIIESLKRIPWLKRPTAQLFLRLTENDKPCGHDPRVVLEKIVAQFAERKLTPVMAPELEFFLFRQERDSNGTPQIPPTRINGDNTTGGQLYSTELLADHADMLHEIRDVCQQMDVPLTALGKELSAGQWELNLNHVSCPLQAADHAQTLKRVIKAIAKKYGYIASFMAKPFAHLDGNGFHTHVSVLDEAGNNIFDDGTERGTDALRYAIGGLADSMADTYLIFAPHLNSYRRLKIGSHAPKAPTWGYENRYVSMRIPNGDNKARRIEYRLGGADANAYLLLAALLAGILHGIDNKIDPGEPCKDKNTAENSTAVLPQNWYEALSVFEQSGYIRNKLGEEFQQAYSAVKRVEQAEFDAIISKQEYDAYLVSS
ncbi:MAG: glutamine synthetase family protein [Pseudomonadales bacterium]